MMLYYKIERLKYGRREGVRLKEKYMKIAKGIFLFCFGLLLPVSVFAACEDNLDSEACGLVDGCSWYACSDSCHATGTSLEDANCPAVCGDFLCTHDETADSCAVDCLCTSHTTLIACRDSGAGCAWFYCSDSCLPEGTSLEDAGCPAVCGDNLCTHDENFSSCPEDCEEATLESYPETGIFDNINKTFLLGIIFILIGGFMAKVVTAFDVVLQNREIKIRKKRRSKIEKGF
jgi:hypothetical protein